MRIHFIAIGGAIMHSLAIQLKQKGDLVTGSDDLIYEPAKSNLLKHELHPSKLGWSRENISKKLDFVILGMHAKNNNPELLEAKKLNIPIFSFPEYIYKESIHKKRIVISGSHGKTTITSMILHVLNENNIKADYLLGAKIDSLENLVYLNNNKILIVEGDEYFSSAIDQTPKFMHYNPDLLVVSGVEWDHINVFPTLDSYQNAFKKLLQKVTKKSGQIFYCGDDTFLSNFLKDNKCVHPYYLPDYNIKDNRFFLLDQQHHIPLNIFGTHNLYNLEAAKLICLELGISKLDFYSSIKNFSGADKRLTLIKEFSNNSSIYSDFAHSPSKVLATINAVKELYPNRSLIACLQLYTFSSLNPEFIPQYADVFKNADEVWVYVDQNSLKQKSSLNLSTQFLIDVINHENVFIINDKESLNCKFTRFKESNTNLLLMSSGNFSGLDIPSLFSN